MNILQYIQVKVKIKVTKYKILQQSKVKTYSQMDPKTNYGITRVKGINTLFVTLT